MSSDLKVRVSADASKMKSGLNEAQAAAKNFANDLKKEFAAAFAIGALVGGVRSAIAHYGDIGDLAERFNISAVALQKLGFAGDQSGTSAEAVARGYSRMRLSLSEAAQQAGDARTVFLAAGFSLEQLQNGSIKGEDALYAISDVIATARSESEQLAIASAIFGNKLGPELVPMLSQGSSALKALGDKAATLDDDMVAVLKRASDSSKELQATFSVAFGLIAVALNAVIALVQTLVYTTVTGWGSVIQASLQLGEVLSYVFRGKFGEARDAARQLVGIVEEGVRDSAKAWAELPDKISGKSPTAAPSAVQKRASSLFLSEEDKKDADTRAKLLSDLFAQEQKLSDARLSSQQRLNALQERHAALMAQAMLDGWATNAALQKRLEASKLLEQIDAERAKVKRDEEKAAEELARKEEQLNAVREQNSAKGETREQAAERLRAREAQLRKEADQSASAEGRADKLIEAEKVRGQLLDLALAGDKSPSFKAPTVDSLRAVGGGSGGIGTVADPALQEARTGNALLREIRDLQKSALKAGTPQALIGD